MSKSPISEVSDSHSFKQLLYHLLIKLSQSFKQLLYHLLIELSQLKYACRSEDEKGENKTGVKFVYSISYFIIITQYIRVNNLNNICINLNCQVGLSENHNRTCSIKQSTVL